MMVVMYIDNLMTKLILDSTASTGSGVLFQAGVLFSIENVKLWPFRPDLTYFVANIRPFWGTFYRLK